MNSRDVAALYLRSGHAPPASIAAPSAEHIRNTRRKLVDGIEFRSTLEARAYQLLSLWQSAGVISALELQPTYLLQEKFRVDGKAIREMNYTPDFRYQRDGLTFVIETKGHRTQPYRMRRKMFLKRYPEIQFREWTDQTLRELC